VPAEVTYFPLLFFELCWQHVMVYCDVFGLHVTRFPCVDFLFPRVSCARHARKQEVTISNFSRHEWLPEDGFMENRNILEFQ